MGRIHSIFSFEQSVFGGESMNSTDNTVSVSEEKAAKKKNVLSNLLAGFLLGGVTVVYGIIKVIRFFGRRKKKEVNNDAEL